MSKQFEASSLAPTARVPQTQVPFLPARLANGYAGLHRGLTSGITAAAVAAAGTPVTANSAITGAVNVTAKSGKFSYSGAKQAGLLTAGYFPSLISGGYTITSVSPWACEFMLDTVLGVFEVIFRENIYEGIRVYVDGSPITYPGPSHVNSSNTGALMMGRVSGLSAGQHHIRIEMTGNLAFCGVNIGPTDSISPAPVPQERWIVMGDSHTEPTVLPASSTSVFKSGWVQTLGKMLGVDMWSAGSGGTGYLNPGSGGRVKFRDRLSEITQHNPNVIVWAGGANDPSYGSYTAAGLYNECLACYAAVKAALPTCRQIVLAPFFGLAQVYVSGPVYDAKDQIKAAAVASGLTFLDVMAPPVPATQALPSGVLNSSASIGATTISSTAFFGVGAMVQIGTGVTTEIRKVVNAFDSGAPHSLQINQFGQALLYAHSAGETVVQVGESWITGSGNLGNLTANGNADRYVGNDGAHFTMLGHDALAKAIFGLLQVTT